MKILNCYLEYIIESIINRDLQHYIQTKIIPKYKKFDPGHGMSHALAVINFSLKLQNLIKDADRDIIYTVAAYHDIGLNTGRKNHHIESGKIVRNDKNLRKWFNENEIEIIAQACEDHRASSKNPPRSIYGKIVSDADRSDSAELENLIKRVWLYRVNNPDFKNLSDKEMFDDMYEHMVDKYGEGGYAKFILPETKRILGKSINRTKRILKSKDETYKIFLKLRKSGKI